MSAVVIVYHSGYGHTQKLAESVALGVQNADTELQCELIAIDQDGGIDEAKWLQLDKAEAIVFGSPTYMGSVSWQFKRFADESSTRWFSDSWKGKLAAGFTNSASINGDKASTIQYLMTFAMQHGMLWLGTGLKPAATKAADRNDLNYMGGFSGLLAQSPSDSSPEEGPLSGDLLTAEVFGQRIASTLSQIRVGDREIA